MYKYDLIIPQLAELLSYNPKTGSLTWSGKTVGRRIQGNLAGSIAVDGNRYVKHHGENIPYGKICMFKSTGQIHDHVIHLNGDKTDFRLSNISPAPPELIHLMKAERAVQKHPKGVTRTPSGRYISRVRFKGRSFRVGTYDTPEEASRARAEFLQRLISTL